MNYVVTLKIGGMEIQCSVGTNSVSGELVEHVKPLADNMWVLVQAMAQVQKWATERELTYIFPSLNDAEHTDTPQPHLVGNTQTSTPRNQPVTIPVKKYEHGFTDGKNTFKVFGGDYTKFGVPAYDDSCVDGVGLFNSKLGETIPEKPMVAVVQFKPDGKPYRVTEIHYA